MLGRLSGLFLGMFLCVLPVLSYAASLYFGPTSGSYDVGEQFSVNVFVSSDTAELNAVSGSVVASNNNVELISVSQANSIIDFWAVGPMVVGGTDARFEGVMLGGGYRGAAGNVVTLVFRGRSPGDVSLTFADSAVLANDGLGTELPTTVGSASFSIVGVPVPEEKPVFEVPERFQLTEDLRFGDESDEVAYLQMCLADLGFLTDEVTGYFGPATEEAITALQEAYRDEILTPQGFTEGTGIVAEMTRAKLNELCFALSIIEEEPEPEVVEEPTPEEVPEVAPEPFYTNIWFWIGISMLLALLTIILLLIIIIILIRRSPRHIEYRHREVVKKEGATLRKMQRHLRSTKTKIERDLAKIENRLKKIEPDDTVEEPKRASMKPVRRTKKK